ncbi:MAG TPA: T9SS type A sorting domain-containing protein [Bacteroidetes bacterium]|nr:T9SS type A sorting domain-containing protein [Bacteroidota bacterium]
METTSVSCFIKNIFMEFSTAQLIFHFKKGISNLLVFACFCLLPGILAAQQNCPAPSIATVSEVTDSSAVLNWANVGAADFYMVEYGPAGFPLGAGVSVETQASIFTFQNLNPCVAYEAYIFTVCGPGALSSPFGPFSFQTDYVHQGDTCTYVLEFFDGFGDGWNSAALTLDHNGVTTEYTMPPGDSMTVFEFEALSNLPIGFSYSPGFFDFEVSYNIVDPNGLTIFSDGPNPATGHVFTTVACATCPVPLNVEMSDVNATSAELSWDVFPGSTGNFRIEYGPMGFTLGIGTVLSVGDSLSTVRLAGLEENTWYNAYILLDCGTEQSKAVGPVVFQTRWLVDVGVSGITEPDPENFCNLSAEQTITVDLTNFGELPQTLFEFYFAVNGEVASIPVPQDGLFTGVVGKDSTQNISFETTADLSEFGIYVIEAWTEHEDDSDAGNDTFRIEILNAFPKPIMEDFEDGALPEGWATEEFINVYAPGSHGNQTWVAGDNLFFGDTSFNLSSQRVGPVFIGDTLSFDYRYVEWGDNSIPTQLSPGDMLEVQISDDCEETYQTVLTINSDNHVPTTDMATRLVPLDGFDGLPIHIRFLASYGEVDTADYWIDLDNINLSGCPVTFASIVEESGTLPGEQSGSVSIAPSFGTAPYTFDWSIGGSDTGEAGTLEELPTGEYFVEITDANGCAETVAFGIGTLVAVDETEGVENISLFPNPTAGMATLDVNLAKPMDIQARVLNLNGQVVFESAEANALSLRKQIDLSGQPAGLYILQVVAEGKPHYAKLMVAR